MDKDKPVEKPAAPKVDDKGKVVGPRKTDVKEIPSTVPKDQRVPGERYDNTPAEGSLWKDGVAEAIEAEEKARADAEARHGGAKPKGDEK